MTQPIGAFCTIKWLDDKSVQRVYISFGEYDDDTGEDGFGVNDSRIFGYSDDVHGIAEAYEHSFKVLDAELFFNEEIIR